MPAKPKLSNLLAWRAFETAARTGSFVAASAELSVTAAAVSQHVRSLEDYLGLKLFSRTAQGVVLTPEGAMVYPGIREGFQRIADAVERLQHRELEKIVRVTAPPSFASRWMLHRLHRFNRMFPDLSLSLDATGRLVDFEVENVDVGVRYGKGGYAGLRTELLFEEFVVPVCSPSLYAGEDGSAPLSLLRELPLIHDTTVHLEADLPNWRTWLDQRGLASTNAERGLYLPSVLAAQAAVEGRGVLLGRSVIVADDLAAGRLVRPFGGARRIDRAYFLVYPEQHASAPKVQAFRRWITEEAVQAQAAGIVAAP